MLGGPMMGNFGTESGTVTKTTNAILLLPKEHPLVLQKKSRFAISVGRAASACCPV